mgnify:CR=1 FL=1
MVFRPKLSPGKKVGDLRDRNVPLSTNVNQNMAGGGRYGVNESLIEEKKKGTQRALQKVQNNKTMTGQVPDSVVQYPVKPDAIGQTYN